MNAAVLKKVDELTQFVLVESERIRRVKSECSPAAQSATTLLVERRRGAERRAALDAKVFRGKWFWL